jgi:hypothetical protein
MSILFEFSYNRNINTSKLINVDGVEFMPNIYILKCEQILADFEDVAHEQSNPFIKKKYYDRLEKWNNVCTQSNNNQCVLL